MRLLYAPILLGLFSCHLLAQTPEEKQATIKYLQELQTPDGGFLAAAPDAQTDTKPKGGVRSTSAALRALKYFGGAPKNKEAAAKFVAKCYDPMTGAFSDQPGGKGDVFTTAVGLMAVVELKMPLKEYDKAVTYLAENAKSFDEVRIAAAGFEAIAKETGKLPNVPVAWLEAIRSSLPGPDADTPRQLASVVVTAMRLNPDRQKNEAIASLLNRGQQADGGFGKDKNSESDLESTYRVMRLYHMLGTQPAKADTLRAFIAKCRNADGGYGVQPGKPSTVSGTYFAGVILHWLDSK